MSRLRGMKRPLLAQWEALRAELRIALTEVNDEALRDYITAMLDLFGGGLCTNCEHPFHRAGCPAGAHPFGATDHVDCGCPISWWREWSPA